MVGVLGCHRIVCEIALEEPVAKNVLTVVLEVLSYDLHIRMGKKSFKGTDDVDFLFEGEVTCWIFSAHERNTYGRPTRDGNPNAGDVLVVLGFQIDRER